MNNTQKLLNIAIEAALEAGKKTLKYYQSEIDVLLKDDNSPLTQADLESNKVIDGYLRQTGIPVLSEENKILPYTIRSAWKKFWLVDPLDGTKEFINKSPDYTVNIALVEDRKPVLGVVYLPVQSILYFGLKDDGSYKVKLGKKTEIKFLREKSVKIQSGDTHKKLIVVTSRSHLSDETKQFIEKLRKACGDCETSSYGSSLKFCMVAEGSADVYPRLGPTMEWDTAASHAIIESAGCKIIRLPDKKPLEYNKQDLLNPWFIVYNQNLDSIIRKII